MLGHSDLRTTQIYAKVIGRKISEDMSNLQKKLNSEKVKTIDRIRDRSLF